MRLYRQALRSARGDRRGRPVPAGTCPGRGSDLSGDLPGAQETAARVGRRAERRRDRLGLARTALVMEATGARNGTARSAASASRPWPGTTCPMTCGPGCPPGTRRRWCTAASTTGPGGSAGTRWRPPRRRATRPRWWTRSGPVSWPAPPPRAWPSGPCWRAGCSRPPTPGQRLGGDVGPAVADRHPVRDRSAAAHPARARRPRLLPGPGPRPGRASGIT